MTSSSQNFGKPGEVGAVEAGSNEKALLRLAKELPLALDEEEVLDAFWRVVLTILPGRLACVRVVDLRTSDPVSVYCGRGVLREGLSAERFCVRSTLGSTMGLKSALIESAKLRVSTKWDSPFVGACAGFLLPLVAAGEFYGALDIGYICQEDAQAREQDEIRIAAFASMLATSVRGSRLERESALMREGQATVVEHANALILGVDRQWRVTVCNRALCELTQTTRHELIGKDVRDWLPPEEKETVNQTLRSALAGHHARAVEVTLATKNGGRIKTVWSLASIRQHGQVSVVVGVGQDLTKMRELQSQVAQAEKLATLGQLAAGVAHELNNPLTSIVVYADYFLKKLKPAESLVPEPADIEKVRRIRDSAVRIQVFAKELTQYARPRNDNPEKSNLTALVRQSLSFCEHLFDRNGVQVTTDLEEHLPAMWAVPGQIEQVVINLVTNAVHACGSDGHVDVRTFRVGQDEVALEVSDNGAGVPATDKDRIFEPFFTTKSDGKGTGLGLSIVKNIIDQHRGRIRLAEARLGGAAFVCCFPIINQ